jgi:transcriptional regulator with XRE-family HTH domain
MNDIQAKIAELENKKWTLAAIADEIGVTSNAVEKWKAGDRYPPSSKAILMVLNVLSETKQPPKQRRHKKK